MSEYLDAENKRLGDLTDDLLIERQDTLGQDLYRVPSPVISPDVRPGDYPGMTGENVPKFGTHVQSVYDIRPINAHDFIVRTVLSGSGEGGTSTRMLLAKMPAGYVGVLREISWRLLDVDGNPRPLYPLTGTSDINVSIGVEKTSDLFQLTDNVFDGDPLTSAVFTLSGSADKQKTHLIIPEFAFMTVLFSGLMNGTDLIEVECYGNILLNRGYPAAWEIGSD